MRPPGRIHRPLVALLAATTGLTLLTTTAHAAHTETADVSETAEAESTAVEGAADFYTPPSPLPPGADGDLIKHEESEFYLDPVKLIRPEADAHRIMYRSRDTHGEPIAVTGTVLVPDAPWRGEGERPLVSYAPGTQGVGDDCAPSKKMRLGLEYEGPFVAGLLNRGYALVITDYEGLGTPGTHTYVNTGSEGHTVLDAARAAQRLPGVDVPDAGPVAIAGYSQGGGASAAAAEVQPAYAPELDVKGAYAGAPPADLAEVAPGLDGHYAAAFLGYSLLSLDTAYPELDIESLLNAEGRRMLDEVAEQCTAEALLAHAFTRSSDLTVDGRSLTDYLKIEPYASRVAEQRIGHRAPEVPTLVVHSKLDDIVPYGQGRQMARDWCAGGATVRFTPSLVPSHVGGMLRAYPEAVAWISDRFAGEQAPNSCPTLT
ncbi:lipase family protein [Saccharomonospora saliphila]|uniref:lipase family protein n=1 Tax=Saccharomonospora saliphila TaxID=369829 RepID=UPI0003800831|nr:lipase family protein [Saccharomonospora saliphila]